jgi:hypothetical protein
MLPHDLVHKAQVLVLPCPEQTDLLNLTSSHLLMLTLLLSHLERLAAP